MSCPWPVVGTREKRREDEEEIEEGEEETRRRGHKVNDRNHSDEQEEGLMWGRGGWRGCEEEKDSFAPGTSQFKGSRKIVDRTLTRKLP